MNEIYFEMVFKSSVMEWAIKFASTVCVFRLISLVVRKFKQSDAMIFFVKFLLYSILVIAMAVYYTKKDETVSITILDGFTLLFGVIEMVDNFLLWITNMVDIKFMKSMEASSKLFEIKDEEGKFNQLISQLWNLRVNLKAGKVDSNIRRTVVEIKELYRGSIFRNIDTVIEVGTGYEKNFTKCMDKFIGLSIVGKVLDCEYRKERSKYYNSLYINCLQCDEIKQLLDDAINCKDIYVRVTYEIRKKDECINYVHGIDKFDNDMLMGKVYGVRKKIKNAYRKLTS